MPEISPQWLAGFFDGEGCINITVAGRHRRCILRLYIVNTDLEILLAIRNSYGGQLVERPHLKHPEWKPYRALIWTNQQARALLERIGPHINLKTRQLELAREFLELREDPERYEIFDGTGQPRSLKPWVWRLRPEILEREAELKASMHLLNKKGVA